LIRPLRVGLKQLRDQVAALGLGQMSPKDVCRNDKRHRIVAAIRIEDWRDAGLHTGPIPVATVEDLALMQNDRQFQSARANILHQRGKCVALHQRERVCERMERDELIGFGAGGGFLADRLDESLIATVIFGLASASSF
jgi:hypothetical protein